MQIAAYKAGVAFTKAYVGNVHAIAHTLGGMYHVPHGLANAVVLPHVLEYYNHKINKPLVKLAKITNIGTNEMSFHERAQLFIEKIKSMNQVMSIPQSFDGLIKDQDIDLMISRAIKEANPLYPVPVIMDEKSFLRIYTLIQD
jgi:alcohol dehydrogenase class IV